MTLGLSVLEVSLPGSSMLSIILPLLLICGCESSSRSQIGSTGTYMRADIDLDNEHVKQVISINPSGHFQVDAKSSEYASHLDDNRFVSSASSASFLSNGLKCGEVFSVPGVATDATCPDTCPFLAEDSSNTSAVCRFQCVQQGRCAAVNPDATIADEDDMICRGCQVEACEECMHNGADICKTCAPRWTLLPDGTCESPDNKGWIVGIVFTSLISGFWMLYCCQLCCRKNINEDAVNRGIRDRWRSRNKPQSENQGSADNMHSTFSMTRADTDRARDALLVDPRAKVWPVTTNLCRTPVAGPGLMLYFNFQCMLIMWTILVIIGWCVTASVVSGGDLFTIGIRDADTPRETCENVNWGHQTQEKYMYAKVFFMLAVYVLTFLVLIIHATLQFRRYQDVDDATTMKDYCAYVTGLPNFHGSELAEERVKQVIEAATGEKVVGVSICWNFGGHKGEEKVRKSLEYDMCQMDEAIASHRRHHHLEGHVQDEQELGCFYKCIRKTDDMVISMLFGWEQSHDPDVDEEELIKGMASHNKAFVVFNDEAARDAAVSAVKRMQNGIAFEGGSMAKLFKQEHEPESVQWDAFGYTHSQFLMRLTAGLLMIFVGLVIWAVAVYVPYAYYFTSYPYANGDEPSIGVQIAFSFMVTAGNEVLYWLTGAVCEWIGFRYKDGINSAYLLIYTCSCFLCVIMDLAISCWMVNIQLAKSNAFNSAGIMIADLTSWKTVFESYPMQKALGWELFIFAFPACMLAPFVIEPFIQVWLPYWTGWALVKSRPDLNATMEEKCLGFTQDIEPNARYADLILNMMLAVIMFFFPGGYTILTFACLLVSHLFIYWWDHWQTLRATRSNYFASNTMDVSASAFMSVPLGLLLVAIIFKFHCMPSSLAMSGALLACYCALGFTVHVIIHVLIILKFVPRLGKRGHIRSSLPYPVAAKKYACNWFTSNPVHCLRSKYMYKHQPFCQFFVEGKENLIKANPDIGVYYQEQEDDWMPPSDEEDEVKAKPLDDLPPIIEDNEISPMVDAPPAAAPALRASAASAAFAGGASSSSGLAPIVDYPSAAAPAFSGGEAEDMDLPPQDGDEDAP